MRTVHFAYTDIHSLTSRLSLSIHTVVPTTAHILTPYPTLPQSLFVTTPTHSPWPYVSRRYPGPCMSFTHRLLTITVSFLHLPRPKTTPNTISLTCRSCFYLSLPATGFPVTPPEPGPAPSPASGFRPSGLPTPVSPGVPTGAHTLGVCVFSLSSLWQPLTTSFVFHLAFRTQPLQPPSRYPLPYPHHPLLPPPNFPLLLIITHPRVSLAYFLPNPTDPPRHPFGTSEEGG